MLCLNRKYVQLIIWIESKSDGIAIFRRLFCHIRWHIFLLLIFQLSLPTHFVCFTFIVVINNLQSKIGISFDKRCPYIRNVTTPFPTEDAEHNIVCFVVLQPIERFKPVRSEPSCFPWRAYTQRRLIWCMQSIYLIGSGWSSVSVIDITIK